jgi:hypothetical protein
MSRLKRSDGSRQSEDNTCLGSKYSTGGAAIILKKGLVHFLGKPDDDKYDERLLPFYYPDSPIPLRTEVLAGGQLYPFKSQRSAVISHEIGHYLANHSFCNSFLLATMSVAALLLHKKPQWTLPVLLGYGTTIGAYHSRVEMSADNIAGRRMGLNTVDSMIEIHKARRDYESWLWQTENWSFRLGLLYSRLSSHVFHVPLNRRLHRLEKLQQEMRDASLVLNGEATSSANKHTLAYLAVTNMRG